MDYKESRYFMHSDRIQVWCDECKEYVGHFILQGHFMCGKAWHLIGFPYGPLSEPSHWDREIHHTLFWVPYKLDGHIYNDGHIIAERYPCSDEQCYCRKDKK